VPRPLLRTGPPGLGLGTPINPGPGERTLPRRLAVRKARSHEAENPLNPLLHEFNCAAVVVHHTNKPPKKNEGSWSGTDLAYMGAGSAEWANWARAGLFLKSAPVSDIFELCAGKRGRRLNWRGQDETTRVYSRFIAQTSSIRANPLDLARLLPPIGSAIAGSLWERTPSRATAILHPGPLSHSLEGIERRCRHAPTNGTGRCLSSPY
jgi:hypothetical protein